MVKFIYAQRYVSPTTTNGNTGHSTTLFTYFFLSCLYMMTNKRWTKDLAEGDGGEVLVAGISLV